MDLLIEIILELVLDLAVDGAAEVTENPHAPKPLRILCALLIAAGFLCVTGLLVWLGITVLKDNIAGGAAVIAAGVLLFAAGVYKTVGAYRRRTGQ